MTEKEYKKYIYEKAQKVNNKKDLDALLKEIMAPKSEANDYGKICYAMAAAMEATLNYINRGPNGGITGFQASMIGWEMVKELIVHGENKCGLRLIDYENMLYPQYKDKFDKVIDKDTWEALQEEAKTKLAESKIAHPKVIKHWKKIAEGKVPFGYKVR